MKEVILKPEFIIPIFGIMVTFLVYLLLPLQNKQFSSLIHLIFAFITITLIPGTKLFLIDRLHPKWFIFPSFTTLSLISVYLFIGVLVNKHSRHFLTDFILLTVSDSTLGILLGIVMLSFMWSSIPGTTFRYSYGLIFTTALAAHIGKTYSLKKIFLLFKLSSITVCLLSISYVILIPSVGLHPTRPGWKGALIHPNILGAYLSLGVGLWLLDIFYNPKNRKYSILAFILLLFTMINTKSGGGLISSTFLIILIILLNLLKKLPYRVGISVFMFTTALGLLTTIWSYTNFENLVAYLGKDPTFTGRTVFWEQLIDNIWNKSLLGYGHAGFWLDTNGPVAFIGNYGFQPVEGHNGFLDMALDIGLVGLFLFIASLVKNIYYATRVAWAEGDSCENFLPIIFLFFLILSNIVESRLLKVDYIWFYYVVLTMRLQCPTYTSK